MLIPSGVFKNLTQSSFCNALSRFLRRNEWNLWTALVSVLQQLPYPLNQHPHYRTSLCPPSAVGSSSGRDRARASESCRPPCAWGAGSRSARGRPDNWSLEISKIKDQEICINIRKQIELAFQCHNFNLDPVIHRCVIITYEHWLATANTALMKHGEKTRKKNLQQLDYRLQTTDCLPASPGWWAWCRRGRCTSPRCRAAGSRTCRLVRDQTTNHNRQRSKHRLQQHPDAQPALPQTEQLSS